MEDSGINNQPLQTTQKEEPVNLITPPPAYPTPAHPFPKFIPKRIAIIIFLILITTLIVGFMTTAYNLGKNQNNKQVAQAPTLAQSPTPTPDPTADWESFKSQKYGFNIKYPTAISPKENLSPFYTLAFKRTGATQGEFDLYNILAAPDTFIAKDPAAYDYMSADVVNSLIGLKQGETKQIGSITFTKLPDEIVAGQTSTMISVSSIDGSINQKRAIVKNNGNMYMIVDEQNIDPETFSQILSTFKFTDSNSQASAQKYLEIKEYGVKIPLTQNIADAYYLPETASKGYIYLKVHSLDSEPQCKNDPSSTAAIAKQEKNGPFPFDLTYQELKERFPGVEIEGDYYYIDLAQYACAESAPGKSLLEKIRKEFNTNSKKIEKL